MLKIRSRLDEKFFDKEITQDSPSIEKDLFYLNLSKLLLRDFY